MNTRSIRGLANTSNFQTNVVNTAASDLSAVSFEQLGFDLSHTLAAGTARFDFSFDISELPRGTRPESVSLLVAAAGSTEDSHDDLTVVAFMNDVLLGSGILRDAQPEWFEFDIPEGLESRNNFLRVQVMRQVEGGECVFRTCRLTRTSSARQPFQPGRSRRRGDGFLPVAAGHARQRRCRG